ncbi:hypothetical protein [uncultured Brachyspira sp.]|uniref:hypothetical protein n=1 Tax=uncultured Brachyspira sp. TaxID=221953 RepID=UPI0025E9315D|nr:hypothetical protein [uncultured Brachyspira sp.]
MLCIKKYVIKIVLTIAFLLYSFTSVLFAEIDFNFIVPFGYNYTFSDMKITSQASYVSLITSKDSSYYEAGVQSQIGYNFHIKNSIFKSISVMAEVGYQLSPMSTSYYNNGYITNNVLFHTLHIGLIQKFYVLDNLSLGIGGGIRIPFSADIIKNDENKAIVPPFPINDGKYDYNYIKSLFDSRVIPYIKLTLDSYIFFNDFTALLIGFYFTYNMDMKFNTDKLNSYFPQENYHSYSYSSVSFGINIGLSIGRKGSNKIKRIE